MGEKPVDVGAILDTVFSKLREKGIDMDFASDLEACCDVDGGQKVKIVCVAPGLGDSVRELGKSPRDQVVMVRVDEETSSALDAWVETGAVKSRSEAAALFIREGLKVRDDELAKLRDALRDVDAARKKLRRQAEELFGEKDAAPQSDESD